MSIQKTNCKYRQFGWLWVEAFLAHCSKMATLNTFLETSINYNLNKSCPKLGVSKTKQGFPSPHTQHLKIPTVENFRCKGSYIKYLSVPVLVSIPDGHLTQLPGVVTKAANPLGWIKIPSIQPAAVSGPNNAVKTRTSLPRPTLSEQLYMEGRMLHPSQPAHICCRHGLMRWMNQYHINSLQSCGTWAVLNSIT